MSNTSLVTTDIVYNCQATS